jgi:predicted transposase/invertase (TIGR01784 family)
LSHVEVAKDFLETYLPQRVMEHLDLRSLRICKDTFVGKGEEDYSDLLYEISLTGNRKGYVYFLFEHKSYPDLFVGLQLLKYMAGIWDIHRKQHPAS